jgi:hypothetical protein
MVVVLHNFSYKKISRASPGNVLNIGHQLLLKILPIKNKDSLEVVAIYA